MKYSNRPEPEGINTSPGHPLKTFLGLLLAFLILLAFATWVLGKSGAWLATLMPFEKEREIAGNLEFVKDQSPEAHKPELRDYLQSLTDQLLSDMEMDGNFSVRVHFDPDGVLNAFATVGGHVVFYRGLLRHLNSENALAMLLAHELAHVKHRHPIASLGQNLAIEIGLQWLLDRSELQVAGFASSLTQLKFSRTMELDADREALRAVYNRFGHINGALDLYQILLESDSSGNGSTPAFMATHPLTTQRIDILLNQAKDNGWSASGTLSPLPAGYGYWLNGN